MNNQNQQPDYQPQQNQGAPNNAPPSYAPVQQSVYMPPVPILTAGEIAPVASVMDFLWPSLVALIPFFGPIALLIIMLVRAFGSTENPNLKNQARAQLILTLIGIVVGILFLIVFGAIFASIMRQAYYYM